MLIADAETAAMAAAPSGMIVDAFYRPHDSGQEYIMRFRPVGVQPVDGDWPEVSSWVTSAGEIGLDIGDLPDHLTAAVATAQAKMAA